MLELTEKMKLVEAERAETRTHNWEMKQTLREKGLRVYQLPWSVVADRGPKDADSEELRTQINAIWEKFNKN